MTPIRASAFKFLVWFGVTTMLCFAWASYPAWRHIAQGLLSVAPLFLLRWRKFQVPAQSPAPPAAIVIVVGLVALLLFSALMGWTKSSNDWFEQSGLRPLVAFATWLVFMAGGYVTFIKRRAAGQGEVGTEA